MSETIGHAHDWAGGNTMRIEDETEEEAIRQCEYMGKQMEAMERDDE